MSQSSVLCPQSKLFSIEYLPIQSPDPKLVFSSCLMHKYIKVKTNPMYTVLCREFVKGMGLYVKKGHVRKNYETVISYRQLSLRSNSNVIKL